MAAVRPPKPAPMMMTWMPVGERGVLGEGEGEGEAWLLLEEEQTPNEEDACKAVK